MPDVVEFDGPMGDCASCYVLAYRHRGQNAYTYVDCFSSSEDAFRNRAMKIADHAALFNGAHTESATMWSVLKSRTTTTWELV